MVVTETNCTVRSENNHFYAMRDYISILKKKITPRIHRNWRDDWSTWWPICQPGNPTIRPFRILKFKLLLLNILKIKASSAKIINLSL